MTSLRMGDPLLPIGPFQEWIARRLEEMTLAELARVTRMDPGYLKRLRAGVSANQGRIEPQLRVRLSVVERALVYLDTPLVLVYDPDRYPWLYMDRVPRRYPTRAQNRNGIRPLGRSVVVPRGEGTWKKSPEAIATAREMRAEGVPVAEIARMFGVDRSRIYAWLREI